MYTVPYWSQSTDNLIFDEKLNYISISTRLTVGGTLRMCK